MDDEQLEQPKNRYGKAEHLKPWQFKPGQCGNPKGRPPGPSLKEWARSYLERLTDDERLEFVAGIDKKVIWEMAEGKPDTKTTVTAKVSVSSLKELPDDKLIAIASQSGISQAGTSEETPTIL